MLRNNQYYSLAEIIDDVRLHGNTGDDFCLYGQDKEGMDLQQPYMVADYPDVVADRVVNPDAVQAEGLGYVYSGQQFADVISVVMMQKPEAGYAQCVRALDHYLEHDAFLEL